MQVVGFLVPLPEIKPRPSALRAWSPNHWIAREFPGSPFIDFCFFPCIYVWAILFCVFACFIVFIENWTF